MFGKNKRRQARVEISFKHGSRGEALPKEIIEILPGQEFEQSFEADKLWEGDTLIKEFDWVAGFTRVYEYFNR